MPEAAGALAAGVREMAACAIVKHEADSSSELIAMMYANVEYPTSKRRRQGKQKATGSKTALFDIEKSREACGGRPLQKASKSGSPILIVIVHVHFMTYLGLKRVSTSRLPHFGGCKTVSRVESRPSIFLVS